MLADFKITIHSEPPRTVQVKVHDSVEALNAAVFRYNRRTATRKKEREKPNETLLGVCHRFNVQRPHKREQDPLCAIVRLAPPNLGVGLISHEMAHAAVWIWELDNGFDVALDCSNDEPFAWNLGELVRQTVNKLHEKGIFDADNRDPGEPDDS
jgi:hypothetical protein